MGMRSLCVCKEVLNLMLCVYKGSELSINFAHICTQSCDNKLKHHLFMLSVQHVNNASVCMRVLCTEQNLLGSQSNITSDGKNNKTTNAIHSICVASKQLKNV